MGRKPTIPEAENMEERILKAAEELFLEQGSAKTTTAQIAQLAGCNQALVHYYFRTKDNLFDKIFEQKAALLFANILKMETSEMPFEGKLRKMIEAHFDFIRQNPRIAPFIINEVIFDSDRLQKLVNKLRQYPQHIFAQLEPMLKTEIVKDNIRQISAMDLILTVISLNVMPFFILPVVQKATAMPDAALNEMLNHRKEEIIETVLARLKP